MKNLINHIKDYAEKIRKFYNSEDAVYLIVGNDGSCAATRQAPPNHDNYMVFVAQFTSIDLYLCSFRSEIIVQITIPW